MRTLSLLTLMTLLTGLSLACSEDTDLEGGSTAPTAGAPVQGGADGADIVLGVEDVQFDKAQLVAPANLDIALALRNQDAGVLHNVSIYRNRDARQAVFIGELFAGVDTRTYRFRTPEAGSYYFRCDARPDVMNGSFVAQ